MFLEDHFKGKKILITGNTGFKGAWLSLMLHHLGAKIYGLSAPSPDKDSLYQSCDVGKFTEHHHTNINDFEKLQKVVKTIQPDIVFHLAAQAITITAYKEPLDTFRTNAMGTANLLEAIRHNDQPCHVVVVTSDKSYRNNEWVWGYRETDVLAGIDPYSASKSLAEIICGSYYHSFFKKENKIRISTCRAGNVMGGGDWNAYRIIPDCIRAWSNKEPIIIRNPESIRPWNYILDVLTGYLYTAYHLATGNISGEAFNLGPMSNSEIPVLRLVETLWKYWGEEGFEPYRIERESGVYFEHQYLRLNSDKARFQLGWWPMIDIHSGLKSSSLWYKQFRENPENIYEYSMSQIKDHLRIVKDGNDL